jgi:hypothetical protein
MPVALPAAAVYAAMIACAILNARVPLLALATLAAGAAVWFLVVQLFVLRRICIYCTITHAAAISAAVLVLRGGADWFPMIIGAGVVVLLIALQLLTVPRLYKVVPARKAIGALPPPPQSPAPAPLPKPPPAAQRGRQIFVIQRQLSVDANLFPIIGPPDAKHVIVDLMDYTCHQCRGLHPLLGRAIAHYRGEMAVLVVPTPMEAECNRYVNIFDPRHVNACQYARLALAVWHTAPERFVEFHEWLMDGGPVPPPLDTARQRASALLGEHRLSDSLADPRNDQRLADAANLYIRTNPYQLPKVLLPQGVLWGDVGSEENLIKVLDHDFRKFEMGPAPSAQNVPNLDPPAPGI